MFTRNYYRYYASALVGGAPSSSDVNLFMETDGTFGPGFYSNTTQMKRTYFPNYWTSAVVTAKQVDVKTPAQNNSDSVILGYGVIFGTGSTPPTIDDYTLSGDVVTGFECTTTSKVEVNDDYTCASRNTVYTIVNGNDTDITIGEIGIFLENVWQSRTTTGISPTPYHHGFYMVERSVLEQPITIAPGGVGQITYTIQMNYPVA